MKRAIIALIGFGALLAAAESVSPETAASKSWYAVAVRENLQAQFQATLTDRQKQLSAAIAEADKKVDAAKAELAKSCGDLMIPNDAGPTPPCLAKPEDPIE